VGATGGAEKIGGDMPGAFDVGIPMERGGAAGNIPQFPADLVS
jgi:hypothetical protein